MAMTKAQSEFLATSLALLAVSYVGLILRLFARTRVLKSIGIDDALACVGIVFATLCTVMPIAAMKYGFGDEYENQTQADVKPYQQLILVSSIAYTICMTFLKLSLLAFYVRLSQTRDFLYTTYAVSAIVIALGISSTVSVLVQCIPLSMLWDPTQHGHCFNVVTFYYANAGLNVLTDVMIFLLPMRTLWKLHLPLRQRIGLCSIFGLGGLVCVASVVRVIKIRDLLNSTNPTVDLVQPLEWSVIEINVSIFITCVPSFKALIRRYLPSILGTLSYSKTHPSTGHPAYGPNTGYSQNGTASRSKTTRSGSAIGTMHRLSTLGGISSGGTTYGSGDKAKKWSSNSVTIEGARKDSNDSQEVMVGSDAYPNAIWHDVTVTVRSERSTQDSPGPGVSPGEAL